MIITPLLPAASRSPRIRAVPSRSRPAPRAASCRCAVPWRGVCVCVYVCCACVRAYVACGTRAHRAPFPARASDCVCVGGGGAWRAVDHRRHARVRQRRGGCADAALRRVGKTYACVHTVSRGAVTWRVVTRWRGWVPAGPPPREAAARAAYLSSERYVAAMNSKHGGLTRFKQHHNSDKASDHFAGSM